ncbi:MAG: leucine-rich repeat protein [Clostridia bacterium]|nr:leucine-rich repeat protein [Clostridia bacterium]
MSKRKFSMIIFFLSVVSIVVFMCIAASAEGISPDGAAADTSGRCGKFAYWEFNVSTGELKITGYGTVQDYSFGNSPWHPYCSYIKTVSYEDGITNIGNYSFYDCEKLTSISIPDSVTTIGKYALLFCKSLKSVTIPKGVTRIDECVFEKCTSLAEIKVDPENRSFTVRDGALFTADMRTIIICPPRLPVTSFTVPYTVTSIGNNAFRDCTRLSSISIPSSVSFIGSGAFAGCTSITAMYIPYKITETSTCMFQGCTSLQSVILGKRVTLIGESTFCDCVSLRMIKLPQSVTRIEGWAFYNCRSLRYAVIPSGVYFLGKGAFDECHSFNTIYFGGGKVQWNALNFAEGNERYLNASRYYYADLNTYGSFEDVSPQSWYARQVVWCSEYGYISGTGAVTFSPNQYLTRAMLVQMLARTAGIDLSVFTYSGKFKDVKESDWYAKAVEWAITYKVTGGTSDVTFSPNAPVTREQLATFFYAFAISCGKNVSASTSLSQYRDTGSISSWALQSVKWAVASGIISGTSNTTISPKGYATRAQAAVMFYGYLT